MHGVLVGERRHRHVGRAAFAGHRVRDGAPQDRRRRRRRARARGASRAAAWAASRARCATRPSPSARRCAPTRRSRASTCATAASRGVVLDVRRGAARRRRDRRDASEDHVPRPDRSRPSSPTDFVDRDRAVEDAQRHGEGQRRGRPAARVHAPSPASIPRCTAARSCSPSRSTTSRARSRTRSRAAPRRCRSPTSASRRCSTTRSRPRATTSCRCSRSGCRTSGRSKPDADELDAYADRVIARVEAVAPGFTDSILHRQVIGPYEMEHEYGLVGGNIFHGELSPGQLFHMRPAPGYADFRTPIAGLYQASSATHGGGGVTGIPGMNAVHQIAARPPARGGGGVRRRVRSRPARSSSPRCSCCRCVASAPAAAAIRCGSRSASSGRSVRSTSRPARAPSRARSGNSSTRR